MKYVFAFAWVFEFLDMVMFAQSFLEDPFANNLMLEGGGLEVFDLHLPLNLQLLIPMKFLKKEKRRIKTNK